MIGKHGPVFWSISLVENGGRFCMVIAIQPLYDTMTDSVYPRGEDLRNAVRWLIEQDDYSLEAINSAAVRFDLSPLDTEFLIKMFANTRNSKSPEQQE